MCFEIPTKCGIGSGNQGGNLQRVTGFLGIVARSAGWDMSAEVRFKAGVQEGRRGSGPEIPGECPPLLSQVRARRAVGTA